MCFEVKYETKLKDLYVHQNNMFTAIHYHCVVCFTVIPMF